MKKLKHLQRVRLEEETRNCKMNELKSSRIALKKEMRKVIMLIALESALFPEKVAEATKISSEDGSRTKRI